MKRGVLLLFCSAFLLAAENEAPALDAGLVQRAVEALHRCTEYLVTRVSYRGGYVGSYLPDLSDQWGETHCKRWEHWIQPPGSPATGMALLDAWRATGDPIHLDAARKCADALVWGQLECGGWDYIVDLSPEGERRYFYRHNRNSPDPALKRGRNRGTFDDDTSQAATRFLMELDAVLQQKDAEIHEAVMAALDWVLKAQYPNGGFPQGYPLFPRGYHNFVTYNDNNMFYIQQVLETAWRQYGDPRYRQALLKLGDFFLASQMPEPQPVWCQQYDADLKPAWARRFEPPAVTACESIGVMRALIRMALFTEDPKYLKPIPPALAWYRRSRLPNGRWARFYELKTNRPLYFTSDHRTTYRLTYSDHDLPDHYSFNKCPYPSSVERQYNEIMKIGIPAWKAAHRPHSPAGEEARRRAESMESVVREVLQAQTPNGVWLDRVKGGMRLRMQTVQRNMRRLSEYVRLARAAAAQ